MDDKLRELLEISHKARECCINLLNTFSNNIDPNMFSLNDGVQILIFSRIISAQEAIEVLLENVFWQEAAIIALTQFELKLDILYIGENSDRASKWLKHSSETHQPWPVKHKIKEIYAHDIELKSIQEATFKSLSQLKHGNPRGGQFKYSCLDEDTSLVIPIGKIDDKDSLQSSLSVCSASLIQLFDSVYGSSWLIKTDDTQQEELCQIHEEATLLFEDILEE